MKTLVFQLAGASSKKRLNHPRREPRSNRCIEARGFFVSQRRRRHVIARYGRQNATQDPGRGPHKPSTRQSSPPVQNIRINSQHRSKKLKNTHNGNFENARYSRPLQSSSTRGCRDAEAKTQCGGWNEGCRSRGRELFVEIRFQRQMGDAELVFVDWRLGS